MIQAHNLSYVYGDNHVVNDVSLHTEEAQVLGLIGPNGSGKTTVLRMLYGNLTPRSGAVDLEGVPLADYTTKQIAQHIAVVVQEPDRYAELSVAEMVMLGRTPHLGTFQRTGNHDLEIVENSLARVGGAHLASRTTAELSGGEYQRVLIARALAQQADYLLLDEPTNHLDIRYQHEVLALLRSLGLTVVVILHDLNLAAQYCDRIALLHQGTVVAEGSHSEVMRPEILEPVYEIGIETFDYNGSTQLMFTPRFSRYNA